MSDTRRLIGPILVGVDGCDIEWDWGVGGFDIDAGPNCGGITIGNDIGWGTKDTGVVGAEADMCTLGCIFVGLVMTDVIFGGLGTDMLDKVDVDRGEVGISAAELIMFGTLCKTSQYFQLKPKLVICQKYFLLCKGNHINYAI